MKNNSRKTAATARKQPLQRRSVTTVAAIIEAAARILEERGHAGYNTNNIAQLAGVSVGSLYQYFPNKDAITIALLLRELKALRAAIEADAGDGFDAGALERMIETAARHQLERSRLAKFLDLEEARLPADQLLYEERQKLMTIIQSFFEGSALGGGDSDQVAQDVFDIVRGLVDAAGFRGETDILGLTVRVKWAVSGYLRARESSLGLSGYCWAGTPGRG
ncbi:TetR/AcrR family transcriptional regulator [Pseudomonas putida]|uniref:TetR/AcrR family transcriptional regulator n=1 Tax=Pseudomonas putida TaxID=303 RepID=UPI002363809B|nr:TetR/AcrR family transcriptional regulator [Pseudomonas putida]MDD1963865.1 TetR/AcrR family transcriptional regulator [Pseudomonas putida]